MKRLNRLIKNHGIFVASLLLISASILPHISAADRPMTIQEFLLLDLAKNITNVTVLRFIIFGLILFNATVIYALLSKWFAKRRAGLGTFVLASMPVWILMQLAIPRFTLVLTPILVALWAFDRAGRSDKRAALWYALSGVALTLGWLQEPIGATILVLVCGVLLIGIKPRYIKHIARQATLVPIILFATVAALAVASWKFELGIQDYLVRQLAHSPHVNLVPKVLISGPSSYHFGLPGISLVPVSVAALAGLGAWQLFVNRKRARNVYILILPVLLTAVGLQFNGLTQLLLLSIAMIGIATWAVMGVQYLHSSWKRVFPHNRLANTVGDLLIAIMLASLAFYSFWYINMGWYRNPQARNDAKQEWSGRL